MAEVKSGSGHVTTEFVIGTKDVTTNLVVKDFVTYISFYLPAEVHLTLSVSSNFRCGVYRVQIQMETIIHIQIIRNLCNFV